MKQMINFNRQSEFYKFERLSYDGRPISGQSNEEEFQVCKCNGKEMDRMYGLDWLDYGARMDNPAIGLWTQVDPLCEKYYNVSPYVYCAGNPVNYVDPDGREVYMLFYVTGNGKQEDDSMFKASAETRKRDIENSKGFNNKNDIVILRGIQDLGKLGDEIGGIINDYSEQYGKTAEFGIWSHNGLEDGPIGSTETSGPDALDQIQMTVDGWSKINFNWSDNASAGFYGCNSGTKLDNRASFTTTLSGKRNFRDVDIYGQTNFSYPSTSSSSRKTSLGMLMGKFSVPTYMVGCDMGNGLRSYFGETSISHMRKSRNGIGRIIK